MVVQLGLSTQQLLEYVRCLRIHFGVAVDDTLVLDEDQVTPLYESQLNRLRK